MKRLPFLGLIHDDLERVEAVLREQPAELHETIGEAVDHLVSGGGKRIRPALALLSAHLCGADIDRAIPASAAVELLHTATLVHDDLIDGALVRRGIHTLNATWRPAAAVLVGDYIFARAADLAARADSVRLMRRFAETLMVICSGEVRQMTQEGTGRLVREEYERRIYAKTASLIALSAEIGAILAESDEQTAKALLTYGEWLGLAFQVVDDVLDFVADERTLGKPVGSDLRHGLVTLPVLLFLERNPDDPAVQRALTGSLSQEAVREAVQSVAESSAIEQAMETARRYADQARAALGGVAASPYRTALLDLVDFTVQRRF